MRTEHIYRDFAEVKMDHLALLNGTLDLSPARHPHVGRQVRTWRAEPARVDSWEGGSADQTRDWIRNGYNAGAAVVGSITGAPRKRTRWREEGDDLDITRAWSGDPTPFSTRETGVKAGIRVNFAFTFSAMVDHSVIEQYGRWLAQFAAGYATSGHDMEISAIIEQKGVWAGNAPQVVVHHVALKKFGQNTDYTAWSPLFSPTGYRHIVFAMWAVDAMRKGYGSTSGLGYSAAKVQRWGVTFDAETSTFDITVPFGPSRFPAEEMTAMAQAAYAGK